MPRVQTPSHLRREYEIVYLIDQECEEPKVDKIAHHYREMVGTHGGKVVRLDNWGLRRLAYPIQKKGKATYIYMLFLGNHEVVSELERNMRISEDIVRWQTVLVDDQVDPNARPEVTEVTRHAPIEERSDGRRGDRPQRATAPTPMSPVPREEGSEQRGEEKAPPRSAEAAAPAQTAAAAAEPAPAPAPSDTSEDTETSDEKGEE
jgi:small subunit ribosomal protein S6